MEKIKQSVHRLAQLMVQVNDAIQLCAPYERRSRMRQKWKAYPTKGLPIFPSFIPILIIPYQES